MKSIVIKFHIIFAVVMTSASCTKVKQIPLLSNPGDTQSTIKVDTPAKTKPTLTDSSQIAKALFIRVIDASGIQALSDVIITIKSCRLDTVAPGVVSTVCSPVGLWQTDANGTIFIDSSEKIAKPGNGLQFGLEKGNYWTDSSSYLTIQSGLNKVDTLTFTLWAVSWLRVHLQDHIPADSGQLYLFFTPNYISGSGQIQPSQPSSNSNIQFNTDPNLLVGYRDHLKYFSPGVDTTFLIRTCGLSNNQIFVERYISYNNKPSLYLGTQIVNNFDTLDWEINLPEL
jgi:hypothetical protein